MVTCRALSRDLATLATTSPANLSEEVRRHVAMCPACARRLAAARLAQRLVATTREAHDPPPGFAERVIAILPGRAGAIGQAAEVWRPAWKLVPTFATIAAALFIWYQTSAGPGLSSPFAADALITAEHLVLEPAEPDLDAALSALLEEVLK